MKKPSTIKSTSVASQGSISKRKIPQQTAKPIQKSQPQKSTKKPTESQSVSVGNERSLQKERRKTQQRPVKIRRATDDDENDTDDDNNIEMLEFDDEDLGVRVKGGGDDDDDNSDHENETDQEEDIDEQDLDQDDEDEGEEISEIEDLVEEDDEEEEEEPTSATTPTATTLTRTIDPKTFAAPLSTVKGFQILPLTMPSLSLLPKPPLPLIAHLTPKITKKHIITTPVIHQLYFRKHSSKKDDETLPAGKTLFLCNLPADATERHLKRLFRRCGEIVKVLFGMGAGSSDSDVGRIHKSGGHAYVVFDGEEAVERAMAMRARKRIWSDRLEGEFGEDVGVDSRPAPLGLARYIASYISSHPPLEQLKREADEQIKAFEDMEEAKRLALEARKNQPDEDGFILVTRGAGKGRKGMSRSDGEAVGAVKAEDVKGPKEKKLVDFYRFQMREAKRNQLADLRKKFEEDKKRITLLRANRKFKPY
ncbi:hypothetical protein HDU76_013271 [Blyttiomyces sp. JEL0837]|nr:hypothetical protein HDU76_013271 [Blyttiomyces sp. JEL0837]